MTQTPTNSINLSNTKNRTEAYSEMPDLVVGDHIELLYEDSPQTVMHATVSRILTDRDEGIGLEVEELFARRQACRGHAELALPHLSPVAGSLG